jgi:hypothetical protein
VKISHFHRHENAQGLVEFALISTVLVLFFLGTVDFGRFFYYSNAIRSAARVGAEVATTGCANHTLCGRLDPPSINDYVMQATECEATGSLRVQLQPQISCTTCIDTPCVTGVTPCTATPCTPCASDICIQRFAVVSSGDPCSGSPLTPSTTGPTRDQCVKVIAGYNFAPIAPLLSKYFTRISCWTGDTTPHTLCASAAGKVF